MLQNILTRSIWFVSLVLLQALVFNHIHIAGYATPMPYIYILFLLPVSTSRWQYLLIGFAMGTIVDIFSNTPGMAAASMTLTAFLFPLVLDKLVLSERDDEAIIPSAKQLKWSGFARLMTIVLLIHIVTFYVLESFSFVHYLTLLINAVGSVVLTALIVLAFEKIRLKH